MAGLPIITRIMDDVLEFIAPSLCPACNTPLDAHGHGYCASCRISLEPAPYPQDIMQDLRQRFPGEELALSAIGSLYLYTRESPVQRLVHAVKYDGVYKLGRAMGREAGVMARMFPEFADAECIVPVPLHRAKMRLRGFNQAEMIAHGISETLGIPVVTNSLKRIRHTASQTTMSAADRKKNVQSLFRVIGDRFRGVTVMLCDDVLTTGATLNTCAEALLVNGAQKVMALTVARDVPEYYTEIVVKDSLT